MLEKVYIAVPLSIIVGLFQLRVFCDCSLHETVVPVCLEHPYLHLGEGCFCHLDLLFFPLPFYSLSWKVRMKTAHSMKWFVPPRFISACCVV